MPAKSKELKNVVLEYLKRHNTMTLATAHDNVPWAAAVFYANDGFTLYFISNPSICLHCHNIAHNHRVAITINKDYAFRSQSDWRKVKGIQIEGIAKMLTAEEEISQAVTIYTSKYPFTSAYLKSMFSLPREKLEEEVMSLARRIALVPPVAISMLKRSLNKTLDLMGQRERWEWHLLSQVASHFTEEGEQLRRQLETAHKAGTLKGFYKWRDARFRST